MIVFFLFHYFNQAQCYKQVNAAHVTAISNSLKFILKKENSQKKKYTPPISALSEASPPKFMDIHWQTKQNNTSVPFPHPVIGWNNGRSKTLSLFCCLLSQGCVRAPEFSVRIHRPWGDIPQI